MQRSGSNGKLRLFTLLLGIFIAIQCVRAEGVAARPSAAAADEFALTISLDASESSATATASIRIHATKAVIWGVLTSCTEALQIVPGLKFCTVQETATDRSWQRILQVMDYSWFTPRVSYEVLASYNKPDAIVFEKVAGDQMRLRGSWDLQSDGEYTVAHYVLEFSPGFWVPRWFVRAALKRDLPKMLRALRLHAEAARTG